MGQKRCENWVSYSAVILWVKIFVEIVLSSTVFQIQAFLCYAFWKKNSKIQNGCYFWQVKYSLKLQKARLHRWVKNFAEIALSRTVFEIQAFLCLAFLKKNSKIQNGCHFWQVKYSLKLGKGSLHRYAVDQKFCRNRSI